MKIFLGFWLVSITILGSWMIAAAYFETRPVAEHGRGVKDRPPRFVMRLIYDVQHIPTTELPAFLREAKTRHRVDIYLLDPGGKDVLERAVPPKVSQVAAGLRGRRQRVFERSATGGYLGHAVFRRETGPLRAVIVFDPPRSQVLNLLGKNLWLRLVLAVGISGVVCYALSRLLTRRLNQLQQASRRLALGDLDTRIDERRWGNDETDQLAGDFNAMAEQLQQRIQAQKRLLGDVSHELRSPLARLRVALALAEEDGERQAEHLQRIEHEAQRLEQLIDQLIRSQVEGLTLDTHIDLVALLETLCADGSYEGKPTGKRLRFTSQEREAIVATQGDLLEKCFDNILRNALKYTADNTEVRVQLNHGSAGYEIIVDDCGPGVEPAELERMFDPFYRVDSARTREAGGSGLGLAIARRAIDQHGGHIAASNTGEGLRITTTLPASTGH